MPFGLKNAGATYQWLVNRMFKGQIGRYMEVYVDDMLVKSKTAKGHARDLEEVFATLRRHGMKLNPLKCTFGVASGKFLGFIVSARGIEANPAKIQALIDMPSPRRHKDVQSLTGRVAALNRFMSRATDKCIPFFNILRGGKKFEWTEDCERAFQDLKMNLANPPVLSKPIPGETLLLYMASSEDAISTALVREEGRIQHPMYYVSKRLLGAEARYPLMERLVYCLIVTSR